MLINPMDKLKKYVELTHEQRVILHCQDEAITNLRKEVKALRAENDHLRRAIKRSKLVSLPLPTRAKQV